MVQPWMIPAGVLALDVFLLWLLARKNWEDCGIGGLIGLSLIIGCTLAFFLAWCLRGCV
jgi:hypothetical protein